MERKFILSAESACDFTPALAEKYDVKVMPMKYYIGEEEFSSADANGTDELYRRMKAGEVTKTTQPNDFEVREFLEGLLQEGKDILHLSFSSGMSGTAATFARVAAELNKTNANKIYVVDTLCQSSGVALLLTILADKVAREDLSAQEARDFVENTKMSIMHYFVVETLTYLARGGRVSPVLAKIGNLLKLKPLLQVNDEGKIVQLAKHIGRKRSIVALIDKFKQNYNGASKFVYISHADCLAEAEGIKAELEKLYPELNICISPLGPIIASHSGPGTLALYFTADKRMG